MTADRSDVDTGVLEELLEALLEVAARKDALRAWPKHKPPDDDPPVQARRDDDGTLGVFRFFTIVSPTPPSEAHDSFVGPDPVRQMTPQEAKARIEGVDDTQLAPGDEVGVELPLHRLAAIALADVEAVRLRANASVAVAPSPDGANGTATPEMLLPVRIVEMLGDGALADAVAARLSSLRGPPPHVPLRRLVTQHGGDAVVWTAVCDGDPGDLCLLVARSEEHRLVTVPAATSAAGQTAVLRALAPAPIDQSLWRFLEVEGPALLCGNEGSLWSDGPAPPTATGERRLSLEVKSIAIARDTMIYGVARARARLLTWSGDRIVDEQETVVSLPLDLPRALALPWPEGEALDRVLEAATGFRLRLQQRLSALVDARAPRVEDALAGCAFLRVLARAADLHSADDGTLVEAEPLQLREAPGNSDDEICMRLADVGVLVLSPADDVVKLRTGEIDRELFVDGALVDGDTRAWRLFAERLAQGIADSDLDVELAFPSTDDDGNETGDIETMQLSAWVLGLAEREPTELRWPPRSGATSAENASALHLVVDRFADVGPEAAPSTSTAAAAGAR